MTQATEERGQGTTSGAQPSQTTRKLTQGKYVRKKRKYETEDPDITLTWDDVELVANKVQDRSEEVVRTVEAQREEIMAKLLEVHENIQQLRSREESQATTTTTEDIEATCAERR
jgi:NACalpha-BTF3-like transcription factor